MVSSVPPSPEVFARDAMRAAARRVARCVREATAATSRPAHQLQCLLAPVSSPRSSRAPVRWLASAVPPDGFARRGYGRGRGRGGDSSRAVDARASNLRLRDVQRAIVDARDVQTILDLCDEETVARFSSVNVATALSRLAKNAKPRMNANANAASFRASKTSDIRLGEHPVFAALCDRAVTLIKRDEFEHRPVCNSAHALAALQHRGHAFVTAAAGNDLDAPANALWRALHDAMPTVEDDPLRDCSRLKDDDDSRGTTVPSTISTPRTDSKTHISDSAASSFSGTVSARQSTMFLYASALVRDPPSAGVLRGIWRELRSDESRVGSHHVSNLVWALGTLGLDPGREGWGIVDRRVPAAFAEIGAFNSQNVANTWWGFAKLRRAPSARAAATLSRAIVAVAETFKPQELANAMWARAHLAATCGLRVEREVRVAFDAAVAGTLGKNALVSPNEKNKNAGGTSLSFKSKELSQVFWHYASLNVAPADSLWRALDAAALKQAPFASPMDVSLTLWACATLGKAPSPRTWAAMERRLQTLVSRGMVASGPGGGSPCRRERNGESGKKSGPVPNALTARFGHALVEWQQVSNLVWSYAKLRTMPDEATLGAIRAAAARLAREKPLEMTPQDASMLLWGHVTLGTLTRGTVAEETTSGEETETETETDKDPFLDALYSALDRHVDAFKPDELTNALWCLAVARGVGPGPRGNRDRDHKNAPLPGAAYARMWRRLATMEANDFATEDGVLIAHHAAVTHNALLAESNDEELKREAVTFFPPEGRAPTPRPSLVAAAKKAWRAQNAQHENDDALSSSQRRVGTLLRRAGIPHESEKELAGGFGFFPATQTVDFFLTDSRVVVEYDGPHHYYETAADPRRERFFRSDDVLPLLTPDQATAFGDPGFTRNVNTRLRDALLARKEVAAVVTVPWWAMRGVKHADQEKWLVEKIEAVAPELFAPSAPNKTCRRIRQTLIKRWLEASPASSRAKLERDLSVAGKDEDARWAAVVAAASKDATKVRAKLRGEIVEAVERRA